MPESLFARQPIETQVALTSMRDASDLLRFLLTGGNSVKAGALAGALRRIGRPELADEVVKAMKSAGYDVRESDPFEAAQTFATVPQAVSPIVTRVQAMWQSLRDVVAAKFPDAPGLPGDKRGYLEFVEEIYKSDAYHSLSIEGYTVTPELIARVQQGNWDPAHHDDDRKSRDALAARGYWQAFQKVKETIAEIIRGANPGARVRATHMDWYRELFQPSWPQAFFRRPRSRAIATMPSICGHRATCRHGGKLYGTPCRNCSIFSRTRRTPASAPCSGTGCSAISIHTLTGMDGWRAS